MKVLCRFVASIFLLAFGIGAAVGLGAALIDSAPAGADTSITVNDASDPASPNPANCLTSPETDCSLRAALEAADGAGVVDISLPDPSTVPNNPTAAGGAYTVDPANGDLVVDTPGTININGAGASVSVIDAQCGVAETNCSQNIRVLDLAGGTLNVSGVAFEGGDPTATGLADPSPGVGGAILDQSALTLTNSTVTGNTATADGGGIATQGGSLSLDDSTVDLNSAADGGAGIFVTGGDSLSIDGGSVSQNQQTASDELGGGGVYIGVAGSGSVTDTISGATIDGNSVASTGIGGGGGIGIGGSDNTNTVVNVGDSTINDNVLGDSADGGGIAQFSDSTLNVDDSTISGNVPSSPSNTNTGGGGVYLVADDALGPVNLADDSITNNQAEFGAGVWEDGAAVDIAGSTLSDNVAGDFGGGIWADPFGTLAITGSTLTGNDAAGTDDAGDSGEGGGIFSEGCPPMNVINDTITGNQAAGGGGAYTSEDCDQVSAVKRAQMLQAHSFQSHQTFSETYATTFAFDTINGNSADGEGVGGRGATKIR